MSETSIPSVAQESKGRLAEALEFLAQGYSIIPLRPGAKTPMVPWEIYQKRKPTLEEVTLWFKGTDNNIAIVTGEISGVAVVDCDSPEAIDHALTKFPSHQRTQTRKGLHLWFKHPGCPVRNSVNLHGIKMDIRGDGGYVVAPGSRHPTGFIYEREGVWGPTSTLPEFPDAILKVKVASTGIVDAINRMIEGYGPAIAGNGGNNKTYQLCCRLVRGYALSFDEAIPFLEAWNSTNVPPWNKRELEQTLRSAIKSGSEPLGILAEEATQEWRADLILNKAGKMIRHPNNTYTIFEKDARFRGSLRFNTMAMNIYWNGVPITEGFEVEIYNTFARHWGTVFSSAEVLKNALACAIRNPYNPLQEAMLRLPPWDGVPRLDRVATEILHTPDTPLNRAMLRCFFIGAVGRAMHPGGKLDTCLVLVGPQGIGKSTFFKYIGGEFFDDTTMDVESKDRFLAIQKAWIMELAELDGTMSVKKAEHIKALLSSSTDRFRPPYGRVAIDVPRSCVMGGTTNSDVFLIDPSGSRRFWPVRVAEPINLPLLGEWRDQLLAEALALDAAGEPHWFDREQDMERQKAASTHTASDPWDDSVLDALRRLGEGGMVLMEGVSIREILDRMEIPMNTRNRGMDMRIATILRRLGWSKTIITLRGMKTAYWVPDGDAVMPVVSESTDAATY